MTQEHNPQQKWSDEELKEAAEKLTDYTAEAQAAILTELKSRGLPAPVVKPKAPEYFTIPTRMEKVLGLVALIGGVATGLISLLAILAILGGGLEVGLFGILVLAVLPSTCFAIYRSMRKGGKLSILEAQLESKHRSDRLAVISHMMRIEPAGRAKVVGILERVAASDSDERVRQAAATAIKSLETARLVQTSRAGTRDA